MTLDYLRRHNLCTSLPLIASSRTVAMALLNTKIVGHYVDAHYLQYPHAERPHIRKQIMGFAPMPFSALRRNRASLSKLIPVVCSVPAASTSPSSASNEGYVQAASYTPPSSPVSPPSSSTVQYVEDFIEKTIFNCRFFTLMGVVGSLTGSVLCFLKGCFFVVESFREYFLNCLHGIGTGKVILLLVEAIDVYLMGTVMLIFGMGLYELFISTLDLPNGNSISGGSRQTVCGSNLFGLFRLKERPKWLEIRSLDELKTKLGHVIVMILLVGMFEKSKKVPIHTGLDLLCFSASILLSSGCLYFLSKLHSTH